MSEDEDAGDLFFVDKVGEKPNVVGVKGAITKEEEQLALQLFGEIFFFFFFFFFFFSFFPFVSRVRSL
jgi:hypothetical protein